MAKYPLTELGYVAKDYIERHLVTYAEVAKTVTKEKGIVVKVSSFQQARRDDRGFPELRQAVIDYMRERDPALVESSLAAYAKIYRQREG